jgi:hypothetical protein
MSNESVVKFSKKSGSSIIRAMDENPEKVGSILVRIASERYDRDFTSAVVDRVKELIKHRDNLKLALLKTQKELDLFDARIAAIEDGEFKIDGYGKITYTDAMLNFGG